MCVEYIPDVAHFETLSDTSDTAEDTETYINNYSDELLEIDYVFLPHIEDIIHYFMNLLNLHMDVEETEELSLQLLNLTHQYSRLCILMYFIEKYNLTLNINAIMLSLR